MLSKQKFKIVKDVLTHKGTLYKDDIVTLEEDYSPEKHTTPTGTYEYKVTDSVGKIWYINKSDVNVT